VADLFYVANFTREEDGQEYLLFYHKNGPPPYNASLPTGWISGKGWNYAAIAVKKDTFQLWFWGCIALYENGVFKGYGPHPLYGPASLGAAGKLHPLYEQAIQESMPFYEWVLKWFG